MPEPLTEYEALREQLRTDTPLWATHCAKILNKRRELVPLVPHPWQAEFDARLEEQRQAGLPMRAIVLKARKLGFSTWIAAKMLQALTQQPHLLGIVVAQDVRTAGAIFEMAKLMWQHLPDDEGLLDLTWPVTGLSVRPALSASSFTNNGRKFMEFAMGGAASRRQRLELALGTSTFEIDTANAPASGRGTTPSLLHLSEVAWWQNGSAVAKMIGLLNAVPSEPETLVVMESTPNGFNHFQKRWSRAEAGQGDPDSGETYVAFFAPWWRDPDLVMRLTDEGRERFVETIGRTDLPNVAPEVTEDEPMLQEMYDCTPEQLAWRRMAIRTQHEDNVELFKQENPASPEEAFIGSGVTVFSSITVARAIKAAEAAPEPVTGTLRVPDGAWGERKTRQGNTFRIPQRVVWVPREHMRSGELELKVWEHPVTIEDDALLPEAERSGMAGAYVVGADFAEGTANTFAEGDFHAVQVFNHRTRMQAAVHMSRGDIADMALWLYKIGLYYNEAWLVPEINAVGIAPVDALTKDYRYPRVYRRRQPDKMRDKIEDRPGWKTDRVTKQLLEGTGAQVLAEGTHGLRDLVTARQLNSYVVDEKGRHGAQPGEHDDLVMSWLIAHRGMDLLTAPKPRKRGGRRMHHGGVDPLTGY